MECPVCQNGNAPGQKFCGTCGYKLEAACTRCGAANPPHFNFCGQCGAGMAAAGALMLAHSGLITRVNQKTLDLLGFKQHEMQGKPFSLFVMREDLVIFFSNLNELLSSSEKQSFEISLKHKKNTALAVVCGMERRANKKSSEIQISISEISNQRMASGQMQRQQDLIDLIFTLTDKIRTVSDAHLDQSIKDALGMIGLFTKSDRCFIYGINRRLKRLEPVYQWCQPRSARPEIQLKSKSIPLAMVKRAIVRMRREHSYVVNDVTNLTPSERYELLSWHQTDLGAILCHLIYLDRRPMGVIGAAKDASGGQWTPQCIGLVELFGQIAADRLPFAAGKKGTANNRDKVPVRHMPSNRRSKSTDTANVIDISEKRPRYQEASKEIPANAACRRSMNMPRILPDRTRPMLLEKSSGRRGTHQQPVFAGDDGLVLLTCTHCGLQESVSMNRFGKLGNAVDIICSCHKKFTAVLEKRRAFRKSVHLDGYFSLKGDLGADHHADGSIWGSMIVLDLSKAGLRFSSERSSLVHPNDLIMVRFNLDNSNKALIHKAARVLSVTGNEVGCRFEGADSYDITLGFYFI